METLEQYVKSVQSLQERHQNDVHDAVMSLLLTFTHCSGVFIDDFEQVSASWEHTKSHTSLRSMLPTGNQQQC